MPLLIQVDANSGVPVFRQLVDQVRLHIASGMLAAGEELPSTRAMSQEIGVNPMTISKAYVLLEEEGLVERRPGLPLVVRSLDCSRINREREELLRNALEHAVIVARLIGISPTEAAAQFQQILHDRSNTNAESDQ